MPFSVNFAILLTVLLALVITPGTTFGMEFSIEGKRHLTQWVTMRGPIVKGDSQKLIDIVKGQYQWRSDGPTRFILASPGGDVIEALKMAEILRGVQARVEVRRSAGDCASACFFLYLGGVFRDAQGTDRDGKKGHGYLGLHRPYLSRPSEDIPYTELQRKQRLIMKQVAAYMADQMVPQRLIDEMMSRSSTDIYWASKEDVRLIGKVLPEVEEANEHRCRKLPPDSYGQLICRDIGDFEAREAFLAKLWAGWQPGNPLDKYK